VRRRWPIPVMTTRGGPRAMVASFRSRALSARLGREAIELARRHGWSENRAAGVAYAVVAAATISQGHLDEADTALPRAAPASPRTASAHADG